VYTMKKLLTAVLLVMSAVAANAAPPVNVAVIAPSVSTRMEARSILARLGWHETALRDASGILVVVRSMLFNPLSSSYESIKDLQEDAESQLNISGENFHLYIYSITPDLGATQLKHTSYKADD
jgi:hypothetical protein